LEHIICRRERRSYVVVVRNIYQYHVLPSKRLLHSGFTHILQHPQHQRHTECTGDPQTPQINAKYRITGRSLPFPGLLSATFVFVTRDSDSDSYSPRRRQRVREPGGEDIDIRDDRNEVEALCGTRAGLVAVVAWVKL
jgi:hypothetical protein